VGVATLANLGQLAEVLTTGENRARYGNEIYGAFGRDFMTADGQRLMIMAITPRQWTGLVEALGLGPAVAAIERDRGVSFARDEGVRFEHRDALLPLVEAAVAKRAAADLAAVFDRLGCCWGPYRTMIEAARDPVLVGDNPLFSDVEQVSGLTYPAPGAMATLPQESRRAATRAPRLGEHSEEVLAEVLGLSSGQFARLHDQGLVA
jgi:2-methylfumaryl-CoA isomerase